MTAGYRLVSYMGRDGSQPGVLIGERIMPPASLLHGASGIDTSSVLGLLRSWDLVHPRLHAAAHHLQGNEWIALSQAKLMAPILYPGAMFCAGAN